MGVLERYRQLTQQNNQQLQAGAVQPQQPQQPQIDTSDPINSLAGMLVTPAEKEAQQQKMLQNKRRMIAWTGLFDGLRNLANLWGVSKGATSQRYTDNPYQTIESSFSQEQQRQDALNQNRDRYANTLYNLYRQGVEDARKNKLAELQQKNYESLIKERGEKTRQQDELNQAKNEYWNAMAQKNTEQAEYWRLRAQGVPAESAAKIAKEYAQAQKNVQQGNAAVTRANNAGKNESDRKNSKAIKGYKKQESGNGNKGKGKAY